MPRGFARTIATWIGYIWLITALIAAVVLGISVLRVRGAADDIRQSLAQRDYSAAVERASGMTTVATVCQITLELPAPWTLHVVPVANRWVHAAHDVCDIAYSVGRAAQAPSVRELAAAASGSDLSALALDERMAMLAATAADEAGDWIVDALVRVEALDRLHIGGVIGQRVHAVSTTWPSQLGREAQGTLRLTPTLLGFDKPRRYFVALQSNAEMRATGGFVGQFAILRTDLGKVEIERFGTNVDLIKPLKKVAQLPNTELITLTDNPMAVNSNLSPHGPDVAKIWLNIWQQQEGEELDGAIGLDVETAARLIEAGGNSLRKPNGTLLTAARDIADYAQNGVYFDFDEGNRNGDVRKQYQLQVMGELLRTAATSLINVKSMSKVLPQSILEDRVLFHFVRRDLQQSIEQFAQAKDLRHQPDRLFVTWNNWSGNKFDFYIHPSGSLRCAADGMELRMVVQSTADPTVKYPAYIGQRLEEPTEKRASVRDQWLLVLPKGSNLRWLSVDNRIAAHTVVDLAGRSVVQLILDTVAGQKHVVKAGLGGVQSADLQIIGSTRTRTTCA